MVSTLIEEMLATRWRVIVRDSHGQYIREVPGDMARADAVSLTMQQAWKLMTETVDAAILVEDR